MDNDGPEKTTARRTARTDEGEKVSPGVRAKEVVAMRNCAPRTEAVLRMPEATASCAS